MLRKKLYEIADIRAGGTPSRNNPDYWNGNIPWVKISNINGKYVTTYDETITELGLKNSSAKLFEKETILYTIFATLGRVGILQFDATTNQAIAGIKIKDNSISTDYLYYYLRSLESYVKDIGNGAAQQNINQTILKNFIVPVISKEKQSQICSELENIENVLLKKQHNLASLDELIKSRFIEMFGDIVLNDKSWASETITKVCPIKQYDGKITECDGKIWLLNLDLVESNTGTVLDKYYVTKKEIGSSTITFSENNVLYSKLRPYLNKVIIPDGNGYATSEFIPFYPLSQVNKYYLAYALRSDSFVTLINSKASGAKMPRAPMDFIRSFPLPLPPIELQNEFAELVKLIDKSKFIVQKEIKDLQELLDKKMDEYFGQ